MDYKSILQKAPEELLKFLLREFDIDIPLEIVSVEDMEYASQLLLQLSSAFSYLCILSSYAKILTRECKRSGEKRTYEDMVDKERAVNEIKDSVKQKYNAVSRAITIHIENNQELRMNTNGYIKER